MTQVVLVGNKLSIAARVVRRDFCISLVHKDKMLASVECFRKRKKTKMKNGNRPENYDRMTPAERVKWRLFHDQEFSEAHKDMFNTNLTVEKLNELQKAAEAECTDNPIDELRRSRGLSVTHIAKELSAPYRTVNDWCRGNSRPPYWALRLILKEIKRMNPYPDELVDSPQGRPRNK